MRPNVMIFKDLWSHQEVATKKSFLHFAFDLENRTISF